MKNTIRNVAGVALLCMSATACTTEPAEKPPQPVHFACQGSDSITVRFGSGTAVLDTGATSVAMVQTRTADGFRYAGGGQAIRGKGQELHWSDGKGHTFLCHAAPATP